jgi:hypothetical protein
MRRTEYARAVKTAALVLLASTLLVSRASGQAAEAETLFLEGKRLMKEGKVAEACDRFDASDRLDRAVTTLLNLADCREKNGQLATAWAAFLKAASVARTSGDVKLERIAKDRAKSLEPRLAYLTISVPDSSKVDGLAIQRNGAVVEPTLWNTGVPVDSGTYEISASAPGREPWSTRVVVDGDGKRASVEVPRFKELQTIEPGAPSTTAPVPEEEDDDDELVELPGAPGPWTGMRKASVGVAAVGVLAVGAGVFFGLRANDLEAKADERCPAAACSDPEAIGWNEDAEANALRAHVAFGVGGLAIAGAAALWFLGAPDDPDEQLAVTPVIGADGLGLAFGGRF